MKTYTVTFTEEEFWQVHLALEERIRTLDARRTAIGNLPPGTTDAVSVNTSIIAAGKALYHVKATANDDAALSVMLRSPRGPRR